MPVKGPDAPGRRSFRRNHEHAQRNQFGICKIPDFFLQRQQARIFRPSAMTRAESRIARSLVTTASCCLACCHSAPALPALHRCARAALHPQLLFHPLKAALEFAVCFPQRRLGVKRQIARNIHQHKKQVANFVFQPFCSSGEIGVREPRFPADAAPGAIRFNSSRNSAVSSVSLSNRPPCPASQNQREPLAC